jgi:hypothetical protein
MDSLIVFHQMFTLQNMQQEKQIKRITITTQNMSNYKDMIAVSISRGTALWIQCFLFVDLKCRLRTPIHQRLGHEI